VTLFDLDLKNCAKKLLRYLIVDNLETLKLFFGDDLRAFLTEFSRTLRPRSSNLTRLHITCTYKMQDSEETQQAIETFLELHIGIKYLEFDVGRHRLIRKNSLLFQADSSHTLIISTGRSQVTSFYCDSDLRDLLIGCKKLNVLAINTSPIYLGPLMDLGMDFRFGRGRFAVAHCDRIREYAGKRCTHGHQGSC
jgi:hypothetical protein